jgi:oligo-1,6-glucosidase
MVKLRKSLPELVYGHYEVIDKDNEKVYAYTRTLSNKQLLVVLNFSSEPVSFDLQLPKENTASVLMNNLNVVNLRNSLLNLQPYQAVILRIQ